MSGMKTHRTTRLYVVVLSFLFCCGLISAFADTSTETVPENQPPPGPVALHDGYVGDWSDWYGKWVIIAYYAHWCAPCYEEIDLLNKLHENRDSQNLVVLGVDFDDNRAEKLDAVRTKMKIEFPTLLGDPSSRWGLDTPEIIPVTLVIHPNGNLHKVLEGIQDEASLLAAMR